MAEDDAQRQHQLTQAQLEAIENEIKSTQPLTSPLLPIDMLVKQYSNTNNTHNDNDPVRQQQLGFLRSAAFLSEKYKSLRRVRGDGNCYYRAFLYSLCENLLRRVVGNNNDENCKELIRLKEFVAQSLKWVCQYGYDEYTIDMFHEELVELFDFIEEASKKSDGGDSNDDGEDLLENALKQLHSRLNEENACSDYCTWFLRVMTAAQMKSNPDHYLPFVMAENYADVQAFCGREVEPMGRECGMVQVSALAECVGVKVVIEYMDGRMGEHDKKLMHHVFGDNGGGENGVAGRCGNGGGERTSITLLYRPGHYDILY